MKTDCRECPCLNQADDWGNDCNLGYPLGDPLTSSDFATFSNECKLVKIITQDKEFIPKKLK